MKQCVIRALSIVLCLTMALGMMPVLAFGAAAEEITDEQTSVVDVEIRDEENAEAAVDSEEIIPEESEEQAETSVEEPAAELLSVNEEISFDSAARHCCGQEVHAGARRYAGHHYGVQQGRAGEDVGHQSRHVR